MLQVSTMDQGILRQFVYFLSCVFSYCKGKFSSANLYTVRSKTTIKLVTSNC